MSRSEKESSLPAREKWVAGGLLAAAFVLRCFYILRYRYDSDEPQHLHTTWGWTQGLLQYRDFFDNHAPLFHILFSPLVTLVGERTDVLTFMRSAMVPLWFISLWCVWHIGRRLFSARVGLWAAAFISLLPWWFFCSVEYRTDNLWTPLWLGAVAVLVAERLSKARCFAAGLLLGLCFTVSMKTSLLFAVCILAAVATPFVCARRPVFRDAKRILVSAWPVIAGALIAPAAICLFFAAKGAWPQFFYGVIQHNILPGVDERNHPARLRLVFPIALPFLLFAASAIARKAPDSALAARRAFLFLVTGFYVTALYSFWTLLTRQDYLPFHPLVMVLAVAFFFSFAASFSVQIQGRLPWLLGAAGLLEVALVLGGRPPWIDGTQREREILSEVLRLTHPGEFVMDFKGESVFRPRAFYYVMEPLTFVRLRRGMIPDTVAERLVATKTCVVLNQNRWYPKSAGLFMTENYLPVGRMRVAGRVLAREETGAGMPVKFEIKVPASYVAWGDGRPVSGVLDGTPCTGARDLGIGSHEFRPDAPQKNLAVLWARAAELGFAPLPNEPGWQYFR